CFHTPKVNPPFTHNTLKTLNMDDEWDLHAVVRSCTTISNAAARRANVTTAIEEYNKDDFDVIETVACKNDINSFSYSLFSPWEGLEEVYKEGCSQRLKTKEAAAGFVDDEPLHEMLFDPSDPVFNETPSRKRKNQQKKWVVELTQEELCSDTWAWRKYGQKLIKGSPFPSQEYATIAFEIMILFYNLKHTEYIFSCW
ncbi:hypothetical protein M8C21_011860, partial [Ambrosia artemisiifolia]